MATMGSFQTTLWLSFCLLLLTGTVTAQDGVNVTYTVVPQCTTDCVISAFVAGVASCENALDTACTCQDNPYQEWLVDCVKANCTVKEQIISKNIDSRQCNIPLKTKRWDILGAMYALFGLASALMVVRVMVKLMGHGGGWGWDDWLILPAYAALVTLFGLSTYISEIAFGQNMWDIAFSNIYRSLKFFWIADQFYTALISLTKLSMTFFFLRIFGHSRSFRRLAYPVIGGNVVIFITFQFAVAFQCRPVSAFWTYWAGEMEGQYYCFSLYSCALGQAVVSIAMDVIMISLPLHETMKVQLSTRKKFGVALIFTMGFVWTIVGIVRAIIIWNTRVITNITVDMAPLGYWTNFEASIAVICACVPDSRFFLSRLIPKTFGWSTTAKDSDKNRYPLTSLSAKSARLRAIQQRAGMISVTTEFDLKSTVNFNQGSCENLTEGGPSLHEAWERPCTWPLSVPAPVQA